MTHALRPAFASRTGSLESGAEWGIPAQNQIAFFSTSKMSKNLGCCAYANQDKLYPGQLPEPTVPQLINQTASGQGKHKATM